MKRILFVSPTLGNGGAERVMLYLMNYLVEQSQVEIFLLLLKDEKGSYIDNLSPKVNVKRLSLRTKRIRQHCFKILWNLRRIHPDICFIGNSGLNILLAPFIKFFAPDVHFIVRETFVLSARYQGSKLMPLVYKCFYNNYDKIIAQSTDMYEDLIAKWGINPSKCIKINNPIDVIGIIQKAEQCTNLTWPVKTKHKFIAIGRLAYQKGYDMLLQRLSENKKEDFSLLIFGTGTLQTEIQEQIDTLGMADKVKLMGFSSQTAGYIKLCDGLILSSRFEGFPNVLLETNALGKPVLANNCPGGINEIVLNGENGYITDMTDSVSFRESFISFMQTDFDSKTIRQLTEEKYSANVILEQYQKVLL